MKSAMKSAALRLFRANCRSGWQFARGPCRRRCRRRISGQRRLSSKARRSMIATRRALRRGEARERRRKVARPDRQRSVDGRRSHFAAHRVDAETGRLNRWLAAEGERVREGQPLFEIEADRRRPRSRRRRAACCAACAPRPATDCRSARPLAWIVGEDEPFDPDSAGARRRAARAAGAGRAAAAIGRVRRRAGSSRRRPTSARPPCRLRRRW